MTNSTGRKNASRSVVKKLIWQYEHFQGEATWVADSVLGRYAAWQKRGVGYLIIPHAPSRVQVGTDTVDAMEAGQDHFEAQILNQLESLSD